MHKNIFLMLLILLGFWGLAVNFNISIAGAQDISQLERQIIWGEGPSPLLKMTERIDEQARMLPEEIRKSGAVKRLAFFDIAFPNSPQEFFALDGNGVILVTAISHEPVELPLKRVYVNAGDEDIELRRIFHRLYKQNEESIAAKTFGQYRMDGLYLFPVYLKAHPGKIVVDFARNRDGLGISGFDDSDMSKLTNLPSTRPSGKEPSWDDLNNFITREFPGFKTKER